MGWDAYLEFLDPLDIRIKGHRIGIEDVLEHFLRGETAHEIRERYPSLAIESIEAVLAYYREHQLEMDQYLSDLADWQAQMHEQLLADPPPVAQQIRARLQAMPSP